MLDRPADDTGASHGMSAFDNVLAPKRIEERNEGQAENRKIVALDRLEQLHAKRLDLIGADGVEDLFARGGKIAADESRRQLAHRERRDRRFGPDGLAVDRDRDRGMKRVLFSA